MSRTITTIVVVFALLCLVFFLLRRPWEASPEENTRRDSITIAKHDIKRIQATSRALVEKIKADSVQRVQERKSYQDRVVALERRIRAINRERATPSALDSIRRVLFPDGTEIDSTYAMPLQQARGCLQAMEQAPLKDQLISEQKGRIVELEGDVAELTEDYTALDSSRVAEVEAERVVSRNAEAMLADCQGKKKSFLRRVGNTLLDVAKVAGGFFLGKSIH